jgi:hypothetical protein
MEALIRNDLEEMGEVEISHISQHGPARSPRRAQPLPTRSRASAGAP